MSGIGAATVRHLCPQNRLVRHSTAYLELLSSTIPEVAKVDDCSWPRKILVSPIEPVHTASAQGNQNFRYQQGRQPGFYQLYTIVA